MILLIVFTDLVVHNIGWSGRSWLFILWLFILWLFLLGLLRRRFVIFWVTGEFIEEFIEEFIDGRTESGGIFFSVLF